MRSFKYFLLFVLFIVMNPFINKARCQILIDLKKEIEKAIDYKEAILLYQGSLGYRTAIFSGTSYSFLKSDIDGHPFIHSDQWQSGNIYIYGQVFFDIEMKLDIYNDFLVLNHQNSENFGQAIVVSNSSLKGVNFSDKYFLNISAELADSLQIKEGYYEQVYHDKSTVLIKHRKTIKSEVKFGTELYEEFVSDIKYYLICDGKASIINSRKALMKALSKHNKNIKRYIKDNRVKYTQQKLENIIKIVRYYDSLDS